MSVSLNLLTGKLMNKEKLTPILILTVVLTLFLTNCTRNAPEVQSDTWEEVLDRDLHLLGHRNWILVVDKAFPEQSSEGMKYIYVDEGLLPTLGIVLDKVEKSTHVWPIIYRDLELDYVTEEHAPGIEKFREESNALLKGRVVNKLLHEDVFSMLDESSSLFRVLVIKTNGTLPYTSFFLQLDCAYWGGDQEEKMRGNLEKGSQIP